jgi:hypothetical protein
VTQINFSGMEQSLSQINSQIQSLSTADMSDPSNLLAMQNEMMMMETEYGAMSGMISDIKTVSMQIIQHF